MPQFIVNRIKDSMGAVLASLFLLGCFCIQAANLSLSVEPAELAENHCSDFSSAKKTEGSRSLSVEDFQRKDTGKGKVEESDGPNVRSRKNGGHSSRRGFWDPFLPDELSFVPISTCIQEKASGNAFSIIFSDYHKQSFARAGPGNFLMA